MVLPPRNGSETAITVLLAEGPSLFESLVCSPLAVCRLSYSPYFLKTSAPLTGNKGFSSSRLTFFSDPEYKLLSANFIIGWKVMIPVLCRPCTNQRLCYSECPVTPLSLMLMAALGVTGQRSGVRSEAWELEAMQIYAGKRVRPDGEKYSFALAAIWWLWKSS